SFRILLASALAIRDALAERRKTAIADNGSIGQRGRSEISEVGEAFARTDVDGHLVSHFNFVHRHTTPHQSILIRPFDIKFLSAALRVWHFERDLRMRIPDRNFLYLAGHIDRLRPIKVGRHGVVREPREAYEQ